MKLTLWAAIGALLAAPLAAQAQPPQRAPASANPADPNAAVAPLVYESVIAAAPRQDSAAATPDKRWRAANDAIGGQPGHDHGAQAAPAPVDHGKHHHTEGKQ